MSLRQVKKLQSPDLFHHTDDSEESEATPKKANNFDLVRSFSDLFFSFADLFRVIVENIDI